MFDLIFEIRKLLRGFTPVYAGIYFGLSFQTCGRQFATAGFFFILKLCACACSGYLFRQHVPCQKESIV